MDSPKNHLFTIFLTTLPILDYFAIMLTTSHRLKLAAGLLLMFHSLMHTGYMRNVTAGYLHRYHIGLLFTLSGSYLIRLIGFVIMIDDAWQHEKQTIAPSYRSVLHHIAVPLSIFKRDLIKITGWTWLRKI
ncbi:MAG: hypothetical protein ACOC2E_00095 [Bacteroidota bacterium]